MNSGNLPRATKGAVRQALGAFPAVVLTGPRQVGKTAPLRGEFGSGFEEKANATPVPAMAEPILAWRRILGPEVGSTIVACDCAERRPLAPDLEAVPWREVGAFCQRLIGA